MNQDMSMIDGNPLAFVGGDSVAVLEMLVVICIPTDLFASIGFRVKKNAVGGLLDLGQRCEIAILYVKLFAVAREQDAVTRAIFTSFEFDRVAIVKIPALDKLVTGGAVEQDNIPPGAGNHQRFTRSRRVEIVQVVLGEPFDSLLMALLNMNQTAFVELPQCLARFAIGELVHRFAVPIRFLAANVFEFGCPCFLLNEPKGTTRINRLELAGVADKDHLCPSIISMLHQGIELAAANHPGLVHDNNHIFLELFLSFIQFAEE